ncbi:MAG: LysM peptidoglycan-binding domain-containing protein [Actinomycetota bacterium]|nr:LysM peptidoglycan-binding domain-containing protein [Actinomycetota bacterium]
MAAITHPGFPLPSAVWTRPVRVRNRPLPASVYHRRRLLVAVLILGVLLAGSWASSTLGGGSLTASEAGSPRVVELSLQPVARATHVVAPGDTLWSIARTLVPEGDVRPVVDALAASRDGRPLQVGERIVLP